ncbi:ribonuclease J [Chloroflexota bacterium]
MNKRKLKVIPIGGLGEIGKNMLALEYGEDIIIVDAGLMFPTEEMLGVDLVIPDMTYLVQKKQHIRGIVITHGHEDHTGALPYLIRQINVPVYMTKLTHGLVRVKLKEARLLSSAELNMVSPGETITLGAFKVEFYSVCHSIPDAVGFIIQTPVGTIVHSGDFKLDHTPVFGKPTDISRLAQVGAQGVLLLLADSTYAELPGYTPSEMAVSRSLDRILADAPGRVIVTTFSSLISRIQQVVDAAHKHGRKIFVVGRSMTNNVKMAREYGYLKAPDGILQNIDRLPKFADNKIVLVTTGSQGEPTSALVRIANRDHQHVSIQKGDTIVLSATPIPGNEAVVNRTVDMLFKQGAHVFYGKGADVHVHGHGSQEELKLLLNVVRPRYFMPVHGEYRHLSAHASLAESVGVPTENIFVMEDGDILELTPQTARKNGRVSAGHVYVSGASVGDIGGITLRNRRMLSKDGIVVAIVAINQQKGMVVGRPDIVTRGFIDTRKYKKMLDESRDLLTELINTWLAEQAEWSFMNNKVRETLDKYYYDHTKRHPMILPFLVKV